MQKIKGQGKGVFSPPAAPPSRLLPSHFSLLFVHPRFARPLAHRLVRLLDLPAWKMERNSLLRRLISKSLSTLVSYFCSLFAGFSNRSTTICSNDNEHSSVRFYTSSSRFCYLIWTEMRQYKNIQRNIRSAIEYLYLLFNEITKKQALRIILRRW